MIRGFVAFGLGSVAHGVPMVLVTVALEHRDAGAPWIAALAVVRLAPYLLCSPAAGVLAGRLAVVRVFTIAGTGRAVAIAALGAAVALEAPFAALVVLAFILVAVGTATYPALMRLVRDAVPTGSLDRTSAVAAGLESAAFWGGPALGGLLLVTAGTSATIFAGGAMSIGSIAVARSIPPAAATAPEHHVGRSVWGAFGYLCGSAVRPAVFSVIGVNVLAGLVTAVLVRLPSELGSGDAREYGLLSLFQGCGAVVAFAALVGRVRRVRRPLLPLAAAGTAVAALAAGSLLAIAALACLIFGAAVLASEVVATSTVGGDVPRSYVAPAFGLLDAWMVAAMVTGAAVSPVLLATVGVRWSLVLAGVATPALTFALLRRSATDPRPTSLPCRQLIEETR
jgi:hypothetical protein